MGPSPLLTPRILWAALFFSQVVYFGMLAAPGLLPRSPPPPEPVMFYALAAASSVVAVLSWVMPAVLWRSAAARATLETKPIEPAPSAAHGLEVGPRGFADRDAALKLAVQRGMTPFILGCALNESVSLFGFVLGYVGYPLPWVVPFFVVSWLMMLPRLPTERGFLGPLARAHGIEA